MFEGKPPVAPEALGSAKGEKPEDALCELSWPELQAKLAAARELRASLAESGTGVGDSTLASFDAESARHLAHHQEPMRQDDYERDVNPNDLGNGKGAYGNTSQGVDRKQPAIRGNT